MHVVANPLAQARQAVPRLHVIDQPLIDRNGRAIERTRRNRIIWIDLRGLQFAAQIPVAIIGRGLAILVQRLGIGTTNDRLFTVSGDEITFCQFECSVRLPRNIDQCDSVNGLRAKAIAIDDL